MTRLEEIAAREKAATKGPWYFDQGTEVYLRPHLATEGGGPMILICTDKGRPKRPDAKFLAASRADIPFLLDLVRRLCEAGDGLLNLWSEGHLDGCSGPGCEFCELRAVIAEAKA